MRKGLGGYPRWYLGGCHGGGYPRCQIGDLEGGGYPRCQIGDLEGGGCASIHDVEIWVSGWGELEGGKVTRSQPPPRGMSDR